MIDQNTRIVLDPGHGGNANHGQSSPTGVCAHGLVEKDVTLDLARRVARQLGSVAVLTRDEDRNLSLAERAACAQRYGAKAFVSIHADGGFSGNAGSQVWVHSDDPPGSRRLARSLSNDLRRVGGTRGVYSGQLAVLDPRALGGISGCLIEADNLRDRAGAERLRNPVHLDRMARAIAGGINAWLLDEERDSGIAYGGAGSTTQIGIDVSHHNGTIDWAQVAADSQDIKFAILKVSEGGWKPALYNSDDRIAVANATGARANGIKIGYYHFARPDANPRVEADARDEADYFIHKLCDLGLPSPDLPLVCDFEHRNTALTQQQMTDWAVAFMEHLEQASGVAPLFYTYSSFPNSNMVVNAALTRFPLWLAHYTNASAPTLPRGFSRWHIWQNSDQGTVGGIGGRCDMNQASMADLDALTLTQTLDFCSMRPNQSESGYLGRLDYGTGPAVPAASAGPWVVVGIAAFNTISGLINQASGEDHVAWSRDISSAIHRYEEDRSPPPYEDVEHNLITFIDSPPTRGWGYDSALFSIHFRKNGRDIDQCRVELSKEDGLDRSNLSVEFTSSPGSSYETDAGDDVARIVINIRGTFDPDGSGDTNFSGRVLIDAEGGIENLGPLSITGDPDDFWAEPYRGKPGGFYLKQKI